MVECHELRRHHFEQDVVEFLSRFASVEELLQRRRWEVERAWYAAFNGSIEGKGLCGSLIGSSAPIFTANEAVARYHDIIASRVEHNYVVIPELPGTIAFACAGRLPTFADLQSVTPKAGLPFSLVFIDNDATWSLVLGCELPNLEACLVERYVDDERS